MGSSWRGFEPEYLLLGTTWGLERIEPFISCGFERPSVTQVCNIHVDPIDPIDPFPGVWGSVSHIKKEGVNGFILIVVLSPNIFFYQQPGG